jgi:L-asparagine transporter-like permease
MLIEPIFILILFTVFINYFYGIYHFNYKISLLNIILIRYYIHKVISNYNKYKLDNDASSKKLAQEYITKIVNYMDLYSIRSIYNIDLLDINDELLNKS